jgi:alkylmercury lyase
MAYDVSKEATMTARTTTTNRELARAFEAGLPRLTDDDRRLARSVARLLATEAQALDTGRLAEALGRPEREVEAAIARLPWVVRDEHDRVAGFWGFGVIETPHRLHIGGRELFAFCAMDALYLPFLLDQEIGIESTSPITGEPVALTASPDGLSDVSPVGAAVSVRIPAEGFTGGALEVIKDACHFIHFFASEEAAREWTAEHDGSVVSIEDAFELAARTIAPSLVWRGH